MPEGDTIHRTARTLRDWLQGREVTAARTTVARLPAHKLVGRRITDVEPRAKHLLIRFDNGLVLHTHMRMTGSWHVYGQGDRWRKPAHQARIVIEAGERMAVCFNAPVVELLADKGEHAHPALTRLGPDVLVDPLDLDEVRRRAAALPPTTPIGDALLDQHVVSGVGNIWRCEALFHERLDPWQTLAETDGQALDALVVTAARLMRARLVTDGTPARAGHHVYGRARRPCHRCGTPIQIAKLGEHARDVYWCPKCQVRVNAPLK